MTEWTPRGNALPDTFEGEVTHRLQMHNDINIGKDELRKSLPEVCQPCTYASIMLGGIARRAIDGDLTAQDAIRQASVDFKNCDGPQHEQGVADAQPLCPVYVAEHESGFNRFS